MDWNKPDHQPSNNIIALVLHYTIKNCIYSGCCIVHSDKCRYCMLLQMDRTQHQFIDPKQPNRFDFLN